MKKLLAVMAIALFSVTAHAGFMIEPYLGYETGKSEQGSTENDYSGTLFGARLGYSMLGLMFGVDYMTGSGTYEDSSGTETDIKGTDLGAFVGYEFPIMFRVYASYFFDSKATPDGFGADFEGNGLRLGLGYTGLPFVSVNFEIIKHTFDKTSDGNLVTPNMDVNTYALTLSLPLP